MSNIYLPTTIKVGYQKRSGTYTGKLAYVIYIDEKGVVRKEGSWESWRHKDIDPKDFKNEPTSGFVLNKKVGGYSSGWNNRQTYTRVFDPRGFEFEITIENLLYILENTSSVKGKGLEGDFIYGWQGKDLILIPTSSPDYEDYKKYSDQVKNFKQTKVKAKELIFGAIYKNKQNEELVYLERMDEYFTYCFRGSGPAISGLKRYFFYNLKSNKIISYSSPSVLIGLVDKTPVSNYSDLMDKLLGSTMISPIDPLKDEFIDLKNDELIEFFNKQAYWHQVYGVYNGKISIFKFTKENSIKPINESDYEIEVDGDKVFDDEAYLKAVLENANKSDTYTLYDVYAKNDEYTGYNFNGDTIYSSWRQNAKITDTLEGFNEKYNFKKLKQYLKNGNEKR